MQVYEYDDFETLLDHADSNASTDWEMEFVSDMKAKYNQYGDKCYVSDKQIEILERIAD